MIEAKQIYIDSLSYFQFNLLIYLNANYSNRLCFAMAL